MKEIVMEQFKGEKLKQFRIKSRKDWIIFWFFAVMVSYVAGGWLDTGVDRWLRGMATPWIMDLNMPTNYGRTIVAVILLSVLAEAVLFLCGKPWKARIAVLAAGVALPLAISGMYQVHCRLIVSVLWDEEPGSVIVETGGSREEVQGKERQELLALCRSLEMITDEKEREACLAWYGGERDMTGGDRVWLGFQQKYGHGYHLWLTIQDGHVYLWRGYRGQESMITFFEDNGLIEWVQNFS